LNYDTIQASSLTLFTIATTEGWIGVMWNSVDGVGIDKVPQRDNMVIYIALYIVIVILNCLLFVNMFVGIVVASFKQEKETLLKNNKLLEDERKWVTVQLSAYNSQPLVQILEKS
jgi:hypothetical protein